MIVEEETYLEHFGIRGMRWGQRKARREVKRVQKQQSIVDRHRRVASGVGSKRDKLAVALGTPAFRLAKGKGLQGGAKLTLQAMQKQQKLIVSGEKKAQDIFSKKLFGVDIRNLDYSLIKDS